MIDAPAHIPRFRKVVQQYNKNPDQFNPKETLNLLYDFDQVLGLGLKNIKPEKIPAAIKKLADKREKFRKNKQWSDADRIRDELAEKGWIVEDTQAGPIVKPFVI
jgi:cysteinyl-tRNA synthetase